MTEGQNSSSSSRRRSSSSRRRRSSSSGGSSDGKAWEHYSRHSTKDTRLTPSEFIHVASRGRRWLAHHLQNVGKLLLNSSIDFADVEPRRITGSAHQVAWPRYETPGVGYKARSWSE